MVMGVAADSLLSGAMFDLDIDPPLARRPQGGGIRSTNIYRGMTDQVGLVHAVIGVHRIGVRFWIFLDMEDVEAMSKYSWSIKPGHKTNYAMTSKPGDASTITMHQLLLGSTGIDHIDHNGLNNRRCNLRSATGVENVRYRRPMGQRKYKGITKRNIGWTARIFSNGRSSNLGTYASEVEAAIAYNRAAIYLHGEFAYVNDIPGWESWQIRPLTSQRFDRSSLTNED
jgi:hypothetical protein